MPSIRSTSPPSLRRESKSIVLRKWLLTGTLRSSGRGKIKNYGSDRILTYITYQFGPNQDQRYRICTSNFGKIRNNGHLKENVTLKVRYVKLIEATMTIYKVF